ncbi:MAG TPA: hypothetical protein VGB54_05235 [Allosphingosinicella sp.]
MVEPIADIAEFLGKYAPGELSALRAGFPDQKHLFERSGLAMGGDDRAEQRAEAEPRVEAARRMLETVTTVADQALDDATSRLRFSRKLELIGSLVALISSAGVVTALLGKRPEAALVIALVSFAAGAVPLVATWLKGTLSGAGVAEASVRLREKSWDAQLLRAQATSGAAAADDLVQKANMLARDLTMALADLGYRPAARPV